jgi:hypothetical protein
VSKSAARPCAARPQWLAGLNVEESADAEHVSVNDKAQVIAGLRRRDNEGAKLGHRATFCGR